MKELAAMFIPIEIGLMIFSGGALFLLAPGLMRIFSASEEVISLGSIVLRMVAVSEPFYGFSIITDIIYTLCRGRANFHAFLCSGFHIPFT